MSKPSLFFPLALLTHSALADSACVESAFKTCTTKLNGSYGPVVLGWRSSSDIIISALAVYVTCTWSILRFNVPDSARSFWSQALSYFGWVGTAFTAPEAIAVLAWFENGAAQSNRAIMKRLGAGAWTLQHAFMANMGGIVVRAGGGEGGRQEEFIATGPMLELLVKEGVIDIPDIEEEDIRDKSKVDVIGKLLTISQAVWLVTTVIARKASGLKVAPVEMTACLHFMVSLTTYALQWHKPQGVRKPIVIETQSVLDDALRLQLKKLADVDSDKALDSLRTVPSILVLRSYSDVATELSGTHFLLVLGIILIALTSRIVPIACANDVFLVQENEKSQFRGSAIAALVLQVCIPVWMVLAFRSWKQKVLEKAMLSSLWVPIYGLCFTAGWFFTSAVIGSIYGAAEAFYPLAWGDFIPHI